MSIEQSDDIYQQASAWRAVWELLITLPIFEDYRVSSQPTGKGAALLALEILSEPKDRAEIESLRKRVAELERDNNHLTNSRDDYSGKIHTLQSMLRQAGFPMRIKLGEDLHGNEDFARVRPEVQLKEAISKIERLQAALEQARHPLEIAQKQLDNQRRIFGEDNFDADFHGEVTDALAAINAALAGDTAKPEANS